MVLGDLALGCSAHLGSLERLRDPSNPRSTGRSCKLFLPKVPASRFTVHLRADFSASRILSDGHCAESYRSCNPRALSRDFGAGYKAAARWAITQFARLRLFVDPPRTRR